MEPSSLGFRFVYLVSLACVLIVKSGGAVSVPLVVNTTGIDPSETFFDWVAPYFPGVNDTIRRLYPRLDAEIDKETKELITTMVAPINATAAYLGSQIHNLNETVKGLNTKIEKLETGLKTKIDKQGIQLGRLEFKLDVLSASVNEQTKAQNHQNELFNSQFLVILQLLNRIIPTPSSTTTTTQAPRSILSNEIIKDGQ